MQNVFSTADAQIFQDRINTLTANSQGLWGKMDVAKMLAHCNVTYEMVYEDKHPKPNFLFGLIMRMFIKKMVTNEKPFKRNSGTAPAFMITDAKVFETEKNRLIQHIMQTQKLGDSHFDGKESHSFGKLNKTEWNNMFAKHLDHHLSQFGV